MEPRPTHLADHGAARRLQHEMLGDHGVDEELLTSLLVHPHWSAAP